MYYLRTMAASAPIQFTVDQTALQQVDTAVANKTVKKRPTRPVPAPMMEEKLANRSTASSEEDSEDQHVEKLTVIGSTSPKASPKNATMPKKKKEDMTELERSIYDDAVLQCSIEVCDDIIAALITES